MQKELLFSVTKKDLIVDFFSGTGAGGQYRNKHQNCVRIRHPESGALSTGQSNRSREANIKEAFRGLLENPRFKIWHARKLQECLSGESLDAKVDNALAEHNLKVEVRNDDGRWEQPPDVK